MCPQKWNASASWWVDRCGRGAADGEGEEAAARARKPRRDVEAATASRMCTRSGMDVRRRARRCAVATTLSSCVRLLKVPFARTVPSRSIATAYGLPGTRSASHAWASACSSKTRTATAGSLATTATAGFRLPQIRQPSDDKIASATRVSSVMEKLCTMGANSPSSGPSERNSSAPAGATRRRSRPISRARAATATARAATPHSATPRPSASQAEVESETPDSHGSAASAPASAMLRAMPPGPTRPCDPKHGQGSPRRPLAIAKARTAAKPHSRAAAASAEARDPAATPTARPDSTTTAAPRPHSERRPPGSERLERARRGPRSAQLQQCAGCERACEQDAQNEREHVDIVRLPPDDCVAPQGLCQPAEQDFPPAHTCHVEHLHGPRILAEPRPHRILRPASTMCNARPSESTPPRRTNPSSTSPSMNAA